MPEVKDLTEEQKIALKRFGGEEKPADAKTQEQLDAEAKLAEELKEAEAKKEKPNTPVKENVASEITDDIILAKLKERGININSLEDLSPKPAAEDEAKKKEQRESEKIIWGLKNGKFNKDQLSNYSADSKDRKGLVIRTYAEEVKALNPELKPEEVDEYVKERFALDKDPDSWQYKQGMKEIDRISDKLLSDNYSSILNLDNEFGTYENTILSQKEEEMRILKEAPVYTKSVKEVVDGLKEIEVPFSDSEKYSIPIPKEIKDAVEGLMLKDDYAKSKIARGYDVEQLRKEALEAIVTNNIGVIAAEAAKLHKSKHEKGVRGIPDGGTMRKQSDSLDHLTEEQKKALNIFKIDKAPVSAN